MIKARLNNVNKYNYNIHNFTTINITHESKRGVLMFIEIL